MKAGIQPAPPAEPVVAAVTSSILPSVRAHVPAQVPAHLTTHVPEGPPLSRRHFLGVGLAGAALILGVGLPSKRAGAQAGSGSAAVIVGDGSTQIPAGQFAPNAFIRIDRSGEILLVMPKVEMGQGVYTALPMLIAEELEVGLDQVRLEHAPPDAVLYADPLLGGQLTGGSTSVRFAWQPLRKAGATARTMLIAAAAAQWKVDPGTCQAVNGSVVHAASNRRLAYGQLVEAAAKRAVPTTVSLKDPKDFKLIGTPAKRLDTPGKVDGTARFGIDVRLPQMQYAVIVNCPVFGGALASVDATRAMTLPGVRQIVKLDNAVAVVAENTWAARRGAAALAIQWNDAGGGGVGMAELIDDLAAAAKKDGAVARHDGDIEAGFRNAKTRLDAVYQQPFLAHATMEPINCTVHVEANACTLWVGTQVPTRAVDAAVKVTGLSPQNVTLHNFLIGGGFGRRLEFDAILQAVKIGQQVKTPVQVIWTREEDIQHDMYRPYYYDTISAGLDAGGQPVAWKHRIVGSSIIARFSPAAFKNGLDPDAIEVAATLPYTLPNQFIDYVRQEPRAVPTAFWRGVGPTRSTFVVEGFVDELAHEAKIDPVQYRIDLLGKSPRAAQVLKAAVAKSNWGRTLPKGQGRGVSVMHAFGSYLGVVLEASVDEQGTVTVEHVVCAVDCGMVVNPDTIEAQIEGGIVFGITAALYSEVTIRNGRVEQTNFTDYPMLRIHQTPQIDVVIVKSSEAPGGIGEPGTAALAPALVNAIFAATGKRLRRLPVGTQLRSS